MVRVLIACVLLVAGCSATPPATTVSTYSPPVYRQPTYGPPPSYYRRDEPLFVPMGNRYVPPALQPPQRVIVQQMPRLSSPHYGGNYPTSRPYQARPYLAY